MGSTTYQWIYDHQIAKKPGQLEPWPYQAPCWVFTTRELPKIPEAEIYFVKGDVKPIHKTMTQAAREKNIWIMGGGELAGKFYDAQLLNEIIWQLAPLTLSGGAPLFPRTTKPPLKLVSVSKASAPFVELRYEVAYN
jgi:dihydrofolate reductase